MKNNITAYSLKIPRPFKFILSFFFSLDKTDIDERLNKDMTDYVMLRIYRSPSIQVTFF